MINHGLLIRDWGLWEVYPFVLNNLCLKDKLLYFIDFGDTIPASKKEIDFYFDKKIKSIKFIKQYGNYYLFFHYPRRIAIMVWRKLKRPQWYAYMFVMYNIMIWYQETFN